MYTRINKKARKNFVGHRTNRMEMYYSTPINKSTKSQLTIKDENGNRVDLNGREVQSLMRVLQKGNDMKENSITSFRY